jgi:hypothetical protein
VPGLVAGIHASHLEWLNPGWLLEFCRANWTYGFTVISAFVSATEVNFSPLASGVVSTTGSDIS